MKQSITFLILFTGLYLIFPSCKRTPNCINIQTQDTVFVSDSFIKLFKPSGFDTLTFVSDKNDTNVFIGAGFKNDYFPRWTTFSYLDDCKDNHAVYSQHLIYYYFSFKFNLDLSIEFSAYYNNNDIDISQKIYHNETICYDESDYDSYNYGMYKYDSIYYNQKYHNGFWGSEKKVLFNFNDGVLMFIDNYNGKWKRIN